MRVTTTLAVLGLAASVSAYSYEDDADFSLAERDFEDSDIAVLQARDVEELLSTLSTRDLEELVARSKVKNFFKKIGKGILGFGKSMIGMGRRDVDGAYTLEVRDLEEINDLLARELGVEGLSVREIEDLHTRDPLFQQVFEAVKRGLYGSGLSSDSNISARDADEHDELFRRGSDESGLSSRDLENFADALQDLAARDLEELEARTPLIGAIVKGASKIGGKVFNKIRKHKGSIADGAMQGAGMVQQQRQQQQQQRRDLEDDEDLSIRDLDELAYEDAELFVRSEFDYDY